MKTYSVMAYPYAVQFGSIEVPDGIEDIHEYISENWNKINFGKPELDYENTDFEFAEEE